MFHWTNCKYVHKGLNSKLTPLLVMAKPFAFCLHAVECILVYKKQESKRQLLHKWFGYSSISLSPKKNASKTMHSLDKVKKL